MVVMRDKGGLYNDKRWVYSIFKWRGLKFFLFLISTHWLDWTGLDFSLCEWLSPFVTVSLCLSLCVVVVCCVPVIFFHLTFLSFHSQINHFTTFILSPFFPPFTWTHPLPLAIMSTIQHYSHNLTIQWQDHPTPTNPHFTFTPPVIAHHAWTWLLDLHLRLHSLPTQYFLLLKTLKRVSI